MCEEAERETEGRWALRYRGHWGPFLLGIHCWQHRSPDAEPRTRTFRTRVLALEAAAASCYTAARPVRVVVAIERARVRRRRPAEKS